MSEQKFTEQKMEALGRLAGKMAHDFNNLLNVIEGNADFLKDFLPRNDPHQEEVEEIKKAVRWGTSLTQQLLILGQQQLFQPQRVNLNDLSSEMGGTFKQKINDSITFELIQGKNLNPIQSDPGQMQQVILNLVLNALDAMPKGGN